jgi:gas vesicle protein
MKEETKINDISNSLVVPFLVGGLVGAGIMLLLAPKAGKEIRHDISNAAINTRERIMLAVDKGKELYDENKSAVTGAIDAGKTAYIREKERHIQAA